MKTKKLRADKVSRDDAAKENTPEKSERERVLEDMDDEYQRTMGQQETEDQEEKAESDMSSGEKEKEIQKEIELLAENDNEDTEAETEKKEEEPAESEAPIESVHSKPDGETAEAEEKEKTDNDSAENEPDGKQSDAAHEEEKVENQLKNSEALKEINKDTIPEFLNYDPETGEQKKEEKKASGQTADNIGKALTDDSLKLIKKLAVTLKGNNVIIGIDDALTKTGIFDKPLNGILETIENAEFDNMRSAVLGLVSDYQKPKFREENPLTYEIANLIFPTLGSVLDWANKDELAAPDNAQLGRAAESMLSTMTEMTAWQEILDFLGRQGVSSIADKNGVTKGQAHMIDAKKSFADIFGEASKGYGLKKERDSMREQGNEKYARILSGAKGAVYSRAVKNITGTASNVGKGFNSEYNENETAQSGASLGISIAATAINKIINWGFKKSDKNSVLNSPQVFGGVSYNKKLVKEDKFNEILRRVSGIVTKDKVYGAVKTVDAIALHAAMRKSSEHEDQTADKVLADLGFTDRSLYPQVSVYDIMKSSGHEPAGGDWRQELKNSLIMEKKDTRTTRQKVWDFTKSAAKTGWNIVKVAAKSGLPWLSKKIGNFLSKKSGWQGLIGAFLS